MRFCCLRGTFRTMLVDCLLPFSCCLRRSSRSYGLFIGFVLLRISQIINRKSSINPIRFSERAGHEPNPLVSRVQDGFDEGFSSCVSDGAPEIINRSEALPHWQRGQYSIPTLSPTFGDAGFGDLVSGCWFIEKPMRLSDDRHFRHRGHL